MKLIGREAIEARLSKLDLIPLIEAGFVAYSAGQAVVPPVAELLLAEHHGEVHIKYGYLKGDDVYVIKIASGFYQNARLGLPSSNGMMLVFQQRSGQPLAVLADEGHLTDVRTAVAGAIATKQLAPKEIHSIGIVGTGIQARLQLRYLQTVTDCRKVMVWGRKPEAVTGYIADMQQEGFDVQAAASIRALQQSCQLIVTTTPSTTPLLEAAYLQAGTHITAVGSDTPNKQELEAEILARADLVVVDSLAQCKLRGEASQALRKGLLAENRMIELGDVIAGKAPGRSREQQISIADLTGVAVQDIQIAKAVYLAS